MCAVRFSLYNPKVTAEPVFKSGIDPEPSCCPVGQVQVDFRVESKPTCFRDGREAVIGRVIGPVVIVRSKNGRSDFFPFLRVKPAPVKTSGTGSVQ